MMIQRSARESGNAAHLSGEDLMEEGRNGRRRYFWVAGESRGFPPGAHCRSREEGDGVLG